MKVCILAAGKGTRVRSFGGQLHKALLPVGNMAAISRIVAQFPAQAEFVVAVGHLEEQIRDYLAIAHPDRSIAFVTVDPFEGPGAGPGRSLWACKEKLSSPFYISACDTLITSHIPPLDRNFMGTQPIDDPSLWCTLKVTDEGLIEALHYKVPYGSSVGFVGFAGIVDVDVFWRGLESSLGGIAEYQVDSGFAELVTETAVSAVDVGWIDVGTEGNYVAALPCFEKNYTFYGKSTDVTYRLGDLIVKFFADSRISKARFYRGQENPGFAPTIALRGGFFSCEYVEGTLLSRLIGQSSYVAVLDWLQGEFWREMPVGRANFDAACRTFYEEKTLARLKSFVETHAPEIEAASLAINGLPCRPVRDLIVHLPDSFWVGGLPSTFHGDLHDENILLPKNGQGYVLIDWRQEFAGLPDVGDRYYDLAKFFHTLDLSVDAMESDELVITWHDSTRVDISHQETPERVATRDEFWHFAQKARYDRSRIEILNGLIFVNMAPLYEKPLADYLYLLGRLRLEEALDASRVEI